MHIKLFLNESNNNTTLKLLELVKEITDETKISKLMSNFTKPIPVFEDIQNIFKMLNIFITDHINIHLWILLLKIIYISYGSCFVKERKLNVSFILYLCH